MYPKCAVRTSFVFKRMTYYEYLKDFVVFSLVHNGPYIITKCLLGATKRRVGASVLNIMIVYLNIMKFSNMSFVECFHVRFLLPGCCCHCQYAHKGFWFYSSARFG